MSKRFKSAVIASAEMKWEIRVVSGASLLAVAAVASMIFMAGRLSGLIEW